MKSFFRKLIYLWQSINGREKKIFLFASILSCVAYYFFWKSNQILFYNDSISHLNMARLIVDNLKPGLVQIGSVWLPLDHLLKLTFIWHDSFWKSGFAGSLWSMIAYIGAVFMLYRLLSRVFQDRVSAFLGVLLFASNLNLLYLQSTPMTESLLLFFFISSVFFLYRWTFKKNTTDLIPVGFFVFLTTLTRYDGWFLFVIMLFSVFIISWREAEEETDDIIAMKRKLMSYLERRVVVFATLGGLGIFLWILWNLLIFGNAFYFAVGPFSAKAQQDTLDSLNFLVSKLNVWMSVYGYLAAVIRNVGIPLFIFGAFGFLIFLFKNKAKDTKTALLTLMTPYFFHILSLFIGFSVIFLPELSPKIALGADNPWLNARYGIMGLPAVAFFASYFVHKYKKLKVILLICIAVQFFLFMKNGSVVLNDATIQNKLRDHGVISWANTHFNESNDLILASVSANNPTLFALSIPLSRIIHEGTSTYWKESLVNPALHAKWIMVSNKPNGDPVYDALYVRGEKDFLEDYELAYEGKDVSIFVKRQFPPDFIHRSRNEFILNDKVYKFIGVNSYDLAYKQPSEIDETLLLAKENGINVVRFWAFADGSSDGFQPNPYQYNSKQLDNLGYVITSAEKKKMKLIVTLSNFWGDYGGIPKYLEWAGDTNKSDADTDSFYANTEAQKIYKAYINYVLNYKNPFSNKQFKDETSILAWELMNEPRIYDLSREYQLVNWADDTARYIKSIDPNHLVSPGIEGFTQSYSDYNHGPSLRSIAGLSSFEIMSGHFYIGEERKVRDPQPVISEWATESQSVFRKPIIIGEVGFDKRTEKTNGVTRETLLKNFLDLSLKNKINGVLLWNWALKTDSSFGISPKDPRDRTILNIIQEYARNL